MSRVIKTLDESLKEAKSLASMYRDLINNGEAREDALQVEIDALKETKKFLTEARARAADGLERATRSLHRLENQRRSNVSAGYQGPSKAILERTAERETSLKAKVRAAADALRAMGLNPEDFLNG
tara:strand:- start:27974 stop:28351 length:378 start_codon:yes stop_codon:yes gene_type:complete